MTKPNSTTSRIEVYDAGDLRKYRTEIPNLIFDLGLSPHALALYGHLKRTAGQSGKSWKSRETLAKECNMSTGKVTEARRELEAASLITVEQVSKRKPVEVRITDIWVRNFEHFSEKPSRQNMTAESSEYDTKKEPLEESVEANASSGVAKTGDSASVSDRVIGLEKHVVDKLYLALDRAGFTQDNEAYPYHLGRAQNMLAKMDPTEEELDALPAGAVAHFEVFGKTDAMAALRHMRQQRARKRRLEANQNGTPEPTRRLSEEQAAANQRRREELIRQGNEGGP